MLNVKMLAKFVWCSILFSLLSGISAGAGECPLPPVAVLPSLKVVPDTGTSGFGAIPIILIHGNHAEEDLGCGGWAKFIDAARASHAFNSKYRLYVFLHDTKKSIGFDGQSGNAQELGQALDSSGIPAERPIGFVAHSRGGLVARAYMNRYGNGRVGDRAFILLTLGTPHHGTPAAVPDWGLKTISDHFWSDTVCLANLLYNVTDEAVVPLCSMPIGPTLTFLKVFWRPQFSTNRPGSNELRWDNFESPEDGIPYESQFHVGGTSLLHLNAVPLALPNPHTLSSKDGNTASWAPQEIDTDLHGSTPNPPLDALNAIEKYGGRIVAYGGYFKDPRNNSAATEVLRRLTQDDGSDSIRHLLLTTAGDIMARFGSANGTVRLYEANDGLVPLQSALFLRKNIEAEPIYDTRERRLLRPRTAPIYPLRLKALEGRSMIAKMRVCANVDHLDLIDGMAKLCDGTSLFEAIRQDIESATPTPINQPPTAGFVMTSGTQSGTNGQTLSLSVPVGGTADVTFNGQPPRSSDPDGSITAYEWRINGAVVSNVTSFSMPLGKGTHMVSLIVSDNGGLRSPAATGTVVLTEVGNQPPISGFLMSADGKSARNGQTLTINIPPGAGANFGLDGRAPYSTDPDGTIISCEWSLDGVLQSYTGCLTGWGFLAGTHVVQLVTVDNQGLRSTPVQGTVSVIEIVPQSSVAQWIPTAVFPNPSPRTDHGMAREGSGSLVLFGGVGEMGGVNADTWRFNTVTQQWALLSPTQSPTGRAAHALTEAPCANRQAGCSAVLLFGGIDAAQTGSPYTAGTWVWDGQNWSRPQLTTEPAPRSSPAMAYDEVRNETVLFGGYGEAGNLSDTWVWNGSQWQQRLPQESPPGMRSYTMAFDRLRNETILIGAPTGLTWMETWAWNGTTWTRKSTGYPPTLMASHEIAYDGTTGEIVLFGGAETVLNNVWYDETFTWNGSAWTPRIVSMNPGRRVGHTMTTDSSGQIIMFGGTNGVATQRYGGVWIWQRP